jgi:preprotein translocase subunit SecD
MAEWVDADGAILSYVLKYSSPLHGEPVRETVSIVGTVLSPDAARAFRSQAAALEDQLDELQEALDQTRRVQEQEHASALRRGVNRHGRIVLRLLAVGAPIPEPDQVATTLFDKLVPSLELEVAHASVESDPTTGTVVHIVLSEQSARQLRRFSSTYLDRTVAVVVDDEVVATPYIASPLEDAMAIHGTFSIEKANEVINRMMN